MTSGTAGPPALASRSVPKLAVVRQMIVIFNSRRSARRRNASRGSFGMPGSQRFESISWIF